MSSFTNKPYGQEDSSYQAAGEGPGLRELSRHFYEIMNTREEAKKIREMHQEDLSIMIDKLTLFLCLWLGGPRTYIQKYGPPNMPKAHSHLVIGEGERDAWLLCMDLAIDRMPFQEDFSYYLKQQFRFPAQMIYKASLSHNPS